MYLPVNTILRGGTYRIVRFISSGGFGCTYEAEHIMLEKRVAIKEFFVKDFCNRDETTAHITVGTVSKKGLVEKLRRKFIDEAKALCRLHHPGIVSVSDVFEENGTAYFVMDYVDGKSLSDVINNEGPLSEKRVLQYIRYVSTALQYVHDNNRLHLDIKPGNIMIDKNDRPVLIDFGASKQYDEEAGENTSTLLGKTPGYAPPEQMSNSVVKFMPATDIYALGATLYKMLTGITPLDANLRISGEELEPLPANISTITRNAVATAMSINKHKRPQSVEAFVKLLDGNTVVKSDTEVTIVEDAQQRKQETPIVPVQPTLPKRWWNIILVICIIVGVAIGLIISRPSITKPAEVEIAVDSLQTDSMKLLAKNETEKQTAEQKKREQERLAEEQRKKKNTAAEQIRSSEEQRSKETVAEQLRKAKEAKRKDEELTNIHDDVRTVEVEEEVIVDDEPYLSAEVMPSFQGGDLNSFRNWVQSRVRYPQIANENGIQGNVILTFVIEKDGRLTNIQVLRTPDRSLSDEAIRVLNQSPKWSPGKQNDQAVRIKYTLPVVFRIQN